ncbi:LD-carboxypeptidase [Streptomyces sp. SID5785]|uniref:LD-carboxypeptidase n=1 Tax=Streptomyces sp. SID5785 TaxID=2690309 RepID=UPI001361243B|nr:LD-carboxypeptidase [Streptomyces sp. SID5785]
MTDPGAPAATTRPERLAPGARVAVVAPSGPVPEDRLAGGLDVLRGWGLEPVVAPHVLTAHPEFDYLAGTDAQRAADLQWAWCAPDVDAVFCARGGYGAQRMVELLDWTAMRAALRTGRPKPLVGYSDITALHEAFAVRLGVSTLHGPMVAAADFVKDERAREHLRATLFEPESVRTITAADGYRALVPGVAAGVTLGGCLSLLAAELGAPAARASARGALVCLEDVGEEAYRIDRYLTQLLRAGWLDGAAGFVLGSWQDCEPVRDLLVDRLGGLGVPVVDGFGFGHGSGALTVPLGVRAALDAEAGSLTLDVPALR